MYKEGATSVHVFIHNVLQKTAQYPFFLELSISITQSQSTYSSRAPGLTSGLHGSVNIHRGALLLVPQWQCISSFVFYYL